MKKGVLLTILCVAAAAPAFACDRPAAPTALPDGKSATMEEMMATKKAVDSYKRDMEEYLACEKSTASKDAAQAELVKIADRFNAQVRAFKSKS